MEVYITHYKAVLNSDDSDDTEYSSYDEYFELSNYTNNNADMCNVDFKSFFSKYITEREDYKWVTVLYGTHSLNFTETLHHKREIDIISAKEVKIITSLDDFKTYCLDVFIPNYKEPYTRIDISSTEIDGHTLFLLNLYLLKTEKGIYVQSFENIYAELPDDLLDNYDTETIYCKKEDFINIYTLLQEEYQSEFKDYFLDEFEEGSSMFIISEY